MDLQIRGKRALITGGNKGIGKACAEVLAAEGCDLVLVARDAPVLDAVAQSLRDRFQVNVETIPADLSSDATVRKVVGEAGEIDILVNNAGAIPVGNLLKVDDKTWREAWDLKVFGYISMCREIYPQMAKRGSGVIVNIIGGAGERHPAGYIAGAAGNAGLIGFTRALAHGSHKDGIRVVGINPGAIATERQEMMARSRARDRFGDEERWTEIYADNPFGRAGTPDEIANTVAFFASPCSSYTSGTVLTIDGGRE